MKKNYLLLFILMFCFFTANQLFAEDIAKATQKKAYEVQALKLGFGSYLLGHKLNIGQKKIAEKNPLPVAASKTWTYKFQDDDIFVVADKKTDLIIGIYKMQEKALRQDVKAMVGDLMMHFNEPTLLAHDKMIYWAFDKKGKISQAVFEKARGTGGIDALATVKFSSTEPIFREDKKSDKDTLAKDTKETVEKTADIYAIITSGPLASLFMARHK
jgi:hypothetical protein